MEYNDNIIRFLLYRSDNDRKKLLEATRQIIGDGIGSCHLDQITEKHFLDRGDEYYTRICYRVEREPENVEYLFAALVEWYESWKDEFTGFLGNEEDFYARRRLRTWAYCIINGLPETYARLSAEVSVSLSEQEMKDLRMIQAVRERAYEDRFFVDKSKVDAVESARLEREALRAVQESIREEDDQKVRDFLKGKRLIFYTNGKWDYEKLQSLQYEYGLGYAGQESALEIPKSQKNCDYIVFVTAQAQHDSYYTLLKMYGRSKIFLVSAQNPQLAMEAFIEQLLGYRRA